jgi:hypothetical protein
MARPLHKLSAAFVKAAARGKYSDGGGLWLNKRRNGGSQWFLRVTVHGRRREMGLGSASEVSLKDPICPKRPTATSHSINSATSSVVDHVPASTATSKVNAFRSQYALVCVFIGARRRSKSFSRP